MRNEKGSISLGEKNRTRTKLRKKKIIVVVGNGNGTNPAFFKIHVF